ncbi:MAG TPA: four helix bundle suffix domain-containing protein [Phycisphaerales bacterium]|nr:four helix bundle suffix domain-containing protein [Phycisphaerales bacterium]
MPDSPEHFLPVHRDYHLLLSFQKAEVIFDITFHFCERFLSRGDRTVDQMTQAARSGKQNIIEGSKAGLTSREMEIKLTNVARASLEELLNDYLDYLRPRELPIWDRNSKEALFVRQLSRELHPSSTGSHASPASHCSHPSRTPAEARALLIDFAKTKPPEVVANIALCLIHQTNYLLDQQVRRLEHDFLKHGGMREAMTRARLQHRSQKKPPSQS